jgi:hypothetical protein
MGHQNLGPVLGNKKGIFWLGKIIFEILAGAISKYIMGQSL